MEAKHIEQANALHQNIAQAIEELRVSDALRLLGSIQLVHTHWALHEAYESIGQMHQQMIGYMVQGVKDEQRKKLYATMRRQLFELNNLVLAYNLADSTEEFYAVRRYIQQRHLTIEEEVTRIVASNRHLVSLHNTTSNPTLRQQYDACLTEGYSHCDNVFKLIWTSLQLTPAEQEILHTCLHNMDLPDTYCSVWVSALMLGCYQHFDIAKVKLLTSLLSHASPLLQARSLVALCIILTRSEAEFARYYPEEHTTLHRLLTEKSHAQHVVEVQELLNISQLTEKVVRHTNEALMNTITQLQQTLGSEDTIATTVEHTDVESQLEHLVVRLRSLYQRQADIHYGSFAMFKHRLPFYKTMMNWFVPFTTTHPALRSATSSMSHSPHSTWLINAPLCSNDRYTMAMLLAMMPRESHEEIVTQMKLHNLSEEDIEEAIKEEVQPSLSREIRYYLQDLYRFFALYTPSSKTARQWFIETPVLTTSTTLTASLQSTKQLIVLADDAFALGLYSSAQQLYQACEQVEGLGSEQFYNLGLCLEHNHDLKAAMGYYEKADLLAPHTLNILRALGRGYRRLGYLHQALHYYKACENLAPESPKLLVQIGNLLLELEQYEEALTYFYKADYLNEGETESTRAIAWCSFIQNNETQAKKYYTKLLALQPTNEDYINAGHVHLWTGNITEALLCYRRVTNDDAAQLLRNDTNLLLSKGIPLMDIALICDWLTEQQMQ